MLPIEHNRTLGNIEHNRTLHATIELKTSFMRCVQISYGRDPFNQNSNRSDREKWSTSKGGPVFSKLFRLDRTDPLSFGPKFPEILVEWIAPYVSFIIHTNSGCISKIPIFSPLPSKAVYKVLLRVHVELLSSVIRLTCH